LAAVRVAARGVSQIPFGATSSLIEDSFGVSFILVTMYVTPQMDITRYSINHEFSFGNPNII